MKQWAVFRCDYDWASGGMDDFVGAFETEGEADLFILRSLDRKLIVENMWEYLSRESPKILSPEEFNIEFVKRRDRKE